jgi:hypothetical protein
MQDLRFSWQYEYTLVTSALFYCVVFWLYANISKEHTASIFRAEVRPVQLTKKLRAEACTKRKMMTFAMLTILVNETHSWNWRIALYKL